MEPIAAGAVKLSRKTARSPLTEILSRSRISRHAAIPAVSLSREQFSVLLCTKQELGAAYQQQAIGV